ncbi:MAG: HlyC/CorC family transporter [Gemmatimonadales bacterium]|nr:MAG: HlyC/CorC family transporter [Gemmatimonadales bacterium]
MTGVLLASTGILLVASALLSAAETALFAVGPSRLRTLREEGFRRAEQLQKARDNGGSVRAATLFVNTLLNCCAVGLLVGAATLDRGAPGLALAIPAAVLGVLLLGEGIPRALSARRSIQMALVSAPFLLTIERIARPFLVPFLRLDELLQRRGNSDEPETPDEREVRELSALGQREGVVGEEEHQLVERAFRMDELAAWDVMTPRVDIFGWPDSLPLESIIGELHTVPYSRVPVYGESIDDITGVLYIREAYEAWVAGRGGLPLSKLAREPFFLPGSLPLPTLLRDFQTRRLHMGIVADEFGGTDGLVTLEDVLEELVGEIEDERDVAEEMLIRISKDEIEVDGAIELREVNYAFNLSLPHLEHRSLNGFILEEMGKVPAPGDRLELPGIEIVILEATETQVVRARLLKNAGVLTEGGSGERRGD